MRVGALAAIICAVALATVPPVAAHEEHALHGLTVLSRVAPDVPGLDVRVVHLGAPALAIANRTEHVLEVAGASGEPFLRIGPRGVFANAQSPTTYKSIDPSHDVIPSTADPVARPRWVRFSQSPEWSWFDPRLVYVSNRSAWVVPMSLDEVALDVRGGFEPLSGHGHFVTRLEVDEIADVELRLIQGPVPAIYVRNESGRTMHVAGADDEPFLRIEEGGVWANIRSPSYYSGGSLAIRKVPAFADATAPAQWRKVSDQPAWGWLEYRAALQSEELERDALGARKSVVRTWSPHLTIGGDPIEATGQVVWIPPHVASQHRASWPPVAAAALAALTIMFGLAMLVRRGRKLEPA